MMNLRCRPPTLPQRDPFSKINLRGEREGMKTFFYLTSAVILITLFAFHFLALFHEL